MDKACLLINSFVNIQLSEYKIIPHCGFNLPFLNIIDMEHIFTYALYICMIFENYQLRFLAQHVVRLFLHQFIQVLWLSGRPVYKLLRFMSCNYFLPIHSLPF